MIDKQMSFPTPRKRLMNAGDMKSVCQIDTVKVSADQENGSAERRLKGGRRGEPDAAESLSDPAPASTKPQPKNHFQTPPGFISTHNDVFLLHLFSENRVKASLTLFLAQSLQFQASPAGAAEGQAALQATDWPTASSINQPELLR